MNTEKKNKQTNKQTNKSANTESGIKFTFLIRDDFRGMHQTKGILYLQNFKRFGTDQDKFILKRNQNETSILNTYIPNILEDDIVMRKSRCYIVIIKFTFSYR